MKKIVHTLLLFLIAISFISSSRISKLEVAKLFLEKKEYHKALHYYEELLNSTNDSPEVIKMASICNSKIGDFDKAELWASKLVMHEKASASDYELYFNTLIDNARYNKALSFLKEYNEKGFSGTKIDAYTKQPDFWESHMLDTCFHKINRMSFNSYRSELAPAVKGDFLYFGSVSTDLSEENETSNPSMNIFFAEINDKHSATIRQKTLKETNNSFKDAYINFSADGETVFLTKIVQSNKLMQLYYGKSDQIKMNELQAFKYNSTNHSIGRATLSPDGSTLVFSSNKEGSLGQVDLWMCIKDEQGHFLEPMNLGENINTKENDILPFFATNNRLYFASEGHIGYGRFDLYYTEFKNGKFQKPVNLGNPINTNADDMGICYSERHNRYFFASDRQGSFDIFSYSKIDDETESELVVDKKPICSTNKTYFSVQVLASLNPMDKAIHSLKNYMKGKSYEFNIVKENSWLKFRIGQFEKEKQAIFFAEKAGFENFFVVQMSQDQIIQTVSTN